MNFFAFILLSFCGFVSSGPSELRPSSDLKVCFSDGCVQGKAEKGNMKSYSAWYGIPFATPPTGNLRFRSPQPPPEWNFLWDATYPRNSCIQWDFMKNVERGSEDCLYLNIYAPKLSESRKPLPVLVFIHGGAFTIGSSDPERYGPDYFMDTQEVILVTIQYRLGAFGFLASGDRNCKGNFGLKDQQTALYWVRRNIRAFNGDSHRITVMGQSSGAACVQYQMMSPKSNRLFHRAIMSSGSALAYWALIKHPEMIFRQFVANAQLPNPDLDETETIMNSLRKMSASDLLKTQEKMQIPFTGLSSFGPVIEGDWSGAFLQDDPKYIWESGKYEQRPFLISVNGYEEAAYEILHYNETIRAVLLTAPENLLGAVTDIPLKAMRPVMNFYFNGTATNENFINVLAFGRDRIIYYPFYKTVEQYTQSGNVQKRPVDLYLFNFTSVFSLTSLSSPYPLHGTGHMDDLLYLFRYKLLDTVFKRGVAEDQMKDYFVHYIVDYVKQGVKYSEELRRCSIETLNNEGFCDYLKIQRKDDKVDVTVSNRFDLKMVKVFDEVQSTTAKLED